MREVKIPKKSYAYRKYPRKQPRQWNSSEFIDAVIDTVFVCNKS